MKNLSLILCFLVVVININAEDIGFQDANNSLVPPAGITYNAVHYIGPTTDTLGISYFAVGDLGDAGFITMLSNYGRRVANRRNLSADYHLTGVSFGTGDDTAYGFIVGYKNTESDKWKGAIWWTTDRGWSWYPTTNLPQFDEPTPFLDVHVVNRDTAWVSCGNGCVMRTVNGGGNWRLTGSKPGGEVHFGWLWGIWAPNGMTAWVCSDQSGLISFTSDSGATWTDYCPFLGDSFPDTLAYRAISGNPASPGEIYVAGSKGKIAFTYDGGNNWFKSEPFDFDNSATNCEWVNGILSHRSYVWCVGTGGTVADNENNFNQQLLWFSRKYNLQDIDGGACDLQGNITYLAVGSNDEFLVITTDTFEYNSPGERESKQSDSLNLWVEDYPGDNGWSVRGGWDTVTSANRYDIYVIPLPDRNLNYIEDPQYIMTKWGYDSTFTYDSVLVGYDATTFYVQAKHGAEFLAEDEADVISIDNSPPPKVEGLVGRYDTILDAVVLNWDPVLSGNEPNLGGYWVCPELGGFGINHRTPLYRNYYMEKVPDWVHGHSWCFSVAAMDRSGNWGQWSDTFYIDIPDTSQLRFSDSPYATAFNQGRHLARFPENKMLQMVYEDYGKISYSYSQDNGVHWSKEEIDNGYFPSIGVDQKGCPWIAYWKNGDIVCKVKRPDGSWKELGVFKGNGTTSWAGAPAIALGTIPDGVSPGPFAYITYPVYEGEGMPDMPAPGPYPGNYNCIKLSILDTVNIAHYSIDEGDADCPVCDPAISVTPADLIHLVWQKGDEIYYTTNYDKISYDNFQQAQMQENMNLSESPGVRSQHPFIESYGDRVFAAWKEGAPGEIYRRIKNITPGGIIWQDPENISNSPSQESDYPVLATSDVVAYQEKVDDKNYEIYTWINGDIVNLSETEKSSKYPHIIVEPPKPHEPEVLIDAIWTETITEDTLYEVKFKQYRHPINPDGFGEYLSVTIGDSVASPYCEQRDGRIDYGEFSCDYDNSSLIYTIPYLNPASNYLLRAVVYKEGSQSGKEEVYVDTTFVAEVSYAPYIPETVYVLLPKETMRMTLK